MNLIQKNQIIAVILYPIVVLVSYLIHGEKNFKVNAITLVIFLVLVLSNKLLTRFAGLRYNTKSAKAEEIEKNKDGILLLTWIFFIMACGFMISGKGLL